MGSTCAGRTLKYVEWNRCVDTALRDQLTHLAALGKTTKDTRAMTDEPDWMNPANDRKTPYTEEELERFVSDSSSAWTIKNGQILKPHTGKSIFAKRLRLDLLPKTREI